MSPEASPRYRVEGSKTCVDIRLKTAHQLFDSRDPAPFRERDLDENAVEYLTSAVEEIHAREEVKIVFWIAESPSDLSPDVVREAVRTYFRFEIARLRRTTRKHLRHGQLTLGAGLVVLTAFLTLAEMTLWLPEGTVRHILREGLVITGWVAMWRPIEVLLYDWWPLVQKRRLCERIVKAEITVESGAPAAAVQLTAGRNN